MVQIGDRISLRIQTLAFGGEGLARHEGFVIFVPFTAPGDEVEVIVTEKSARHARGRVASILQPGPDRVEAPCPYYARCGGCQYQHIHYPAELAAKETQVRETLVRIAKIAEPPVLPIIGSPHEYEYRNRITVHAEEGRIGFKSVDARETVDIAKCLLALPEVNDALARLRASGPRPGHYSLRHPGIPPSAFYQANHLLLDTLRRTVAETFSSGLTLGIDAYCGGGLFAEALAGKAQHAVGIERDPRSLRDARRLPVTNLELIEGTVEDELEPVLREAPLDRTGLLLDPPREGLPASLVRSLIELRPAELTYVSCHPPTLARDAQKLAAHYTLVSVQPIDLFPRTSQIECVTVWKPKE